MKKIKVIIIVVVIALVSYPLYKVLYLGGILPLAPNYAKMEKYYNDNYEDLLYVSESLSNINDETIILYKTQGSSLMYLSNTEDGRLGRNKSITDEKLTKIIQELFDRGTSTIRKKNDYIIFTTWSSLNESRGVLYMLGSKKIEQDILDQDYIANLRALTRKGWYYYESYFDK